MKKVTLRKKKNSKDIQEISNISNKGAIINLTDFCILLLVSDGNLSLNSLNGSHEPKIALKEIEMMSLLVTVGWEKKKNYYI